MEALIVSIVDTAIAGENMAIAAESPGLGITFIGGIRNDLYRDRELLGLPQYTIPLFGMTIGVPASRNDVKPRMPLRNNTFTNRYDTSEAADLTEYQATTHAYYAGRAGNPQDTDWQQKMVNFFSAPRRAEVAKFVREQGFLV